MGVTIVTMNLTHITSLVLILRYAAATGIRIPHSKVYVDCANVPGNTGKFFVNVYYKDTSRGFRAEPLKGVCQPGKLEEFHLYEEVGYAWIKGESNLCKNSNCFAMFSVDAREGSAKPRVLVEVRPVHYSWMS